jgi:hypothetical protein
VAHIESGRKTVENQRDLVVFLIGARINKWWLLPIALPLLIRMRTMQLELLADPESGLLGIQALGSTSLMYFRSHDDLIRYAGDSKKTHKPTAKSFFQKIFRNEAIGVWHETFVVPGGNYESLYINMPKFGMGKVLPLVDAHGERATAASRLKDATAHLS